MPTIQIPKVGNIQFPDEMKPEEIAQAAGELHDKALTDGVSKFMENDPMIKGMKTSEKLKALAAIASMLERHPLLAQAVDAGISQISGQSSEQESQAGGQSPATTGQTALERLTQGTAQQPQGISKESVST